MKKRERQSVRAYFQCTPWMIGYQLISTAILLAILALLQWLGMVLIYSTGRVAITSGDFQFVFKTWQGWVFVLLALVGLFFAVSININGVIYLADKAIKQEKTNVFRAVLEAIKAIRRFLNKDGFIICLYIAIGAPLAGLSITIPQTEGFKVPGFIKDMIYDNPLFLALYFLALLFLIWFGVRNIFLLPCVVLDKKPIKEAVKICHEIMKKNWRHFVFRFIWLLLELTVILTVVYLGLTMMPYLIKPEMGLSQYMTRFIMLLSFFSCTVFIWFVTIITVPVQITELTRLYIGYRDNTHTVLKKKKKKRSKPEWIIIVALIAGTISAAAVSANYFDSIFPAEINVKVIAHRLGGHTAAENSITGLKKSIARGTYGYETDIQRSKDGVYVINHDVSFNRVCGVNKKASEMTWDEIRELRLTNPDGTTEAPPSLNEVMNLAKGHGKLYLELKGATADEKMCDDVVQMIRDKKMEKQCIIISMKYDLIKYIYKKYDDIETGYLYYFSYGNTGALDCSSLVMQEEAATDDAIDTIHAVFKKAVVWTVNSYASARKFMDSDIDAIITDEVGLCNNVKYELERRSDYERVLNKLRLSR